VMFASVFCENEGKLVTIVIPNRVAVGCQVKVLKCRKLQRDGDCNDCLVKYACSKFLGEPRFTLRTIVAARLRKKR